MKNISFSYCFSFSACHHIFIRIIQFFLFVNFDELHFLIGKERNNHLRLNLFWIFSKYSILVILVRESSWKCCYLCFIVFFQLLERYPNHVSAHSEIFGHCGDYKSKPKERVERFGKSYSTGMLFYWNTELKKFRTSSCILFHGDANYSTIIEAIILFV